MLVCGKDRDIVCTQCTCCNDSDVINFDLQKARLKLLSVERFCLLLFCTQAHQGQHFWLNITFVTKITLFTFCINYVAGVWHSQLFLANRLSTKSEKFSPAAAVPVLAIGLFGRTRLVQQLRVALRVLTLGLHLTLFGLFGMTEQLGLRFYFMDCFYTFITNFASKRRCVVPVMLQYCSYKARGQRKMCKFYPLNFVGFLLLCTVSLRSKQNIASFVVVLAVVLI